MNRRDTLLTAISILLIVDIAITVESTRAHKARVLPNFSQYQSIAQMQSEYNKCKASAPEGFDCYMQPIMVSKTFIAEESSK